MTQTNQQIKNLAIACSIFLLQAIVTFAIAQQRPAPVLPDSNEVYQLPLNLEPFLAGNFGELRNNHFHAGLDFKTQSTVDHPVYAFADGYVHRVGINAYGYGLVIYVRHPHLGLTSVYAHLNGFAENIYDKVRARQQQMEENNAQIQFDENEIPVKRGEVIALSGNTGSSGGPHVHFELRDCNDEDDEFFNPMPFFRDSIADHKPPRASHIYLYPLNGLACGQRVRQSASVIVSQAGQRTINRAFTAWGRIGVGLKAYDYMENQGNTYGVYRIRLYVDDRLIYDFKEDRFRYSERRYTNSLTDFASWTSQRSMIMKSFIEPGNHLRMIDSSLGDGTVMIDEERAYQFRYVLTDAHGNESSVEFKVKGKRAQLPDMGPIYSDLPGGTMTQRGILVRSQERLEFDSAGFSLRIDPGNLYRDEILRFKITQQTDQQKPCVSKIYSVGEGTIPVHGYMELSIPLPKSYSDTLTNPNQLYVVNVDGGYVGGTYHPATSDSPATVSVRVRECGRYAVRRDLSLPNASFPTLGLNKALISVQDTGSGVAKFKVWIDGKFVPFDQNRYGSRVAKPRLFGIEKGKTHEIRIWIKDNCGNERTIETSKFF